MGGTISRGGLLCLLTAATFFIALARPDQDARACGAAGPFDFDTYEAEDYVTTYGQAIDLAVRGKAAPAPYSLVTGEEVDVAFQGLESGQRATRQPADPTLGIPPSVYKSIAWVEANWSNASGTVPFGGVGPVLRSFDCGYGIGQVTTGMSNGSGTPSAHQAVIGTHYLFNIAEGVRILTDKWNSAPQYRPIAGTGDPAALEDWYYAIWSYNGFAFSNHPLNPSRDPLRGGAGGAGVPIYHCYDPTATSYQESGGTIKFGYGDYTYPERVYGCMRYPPTKPTPATALVAAQTVTAQLTGPKFVPGDIAVVTGTGGDGLNVRALPVLSTQVIGHLAEGAQVTITDGPQSADGLLWWKVHTDSLDGWAADQYLQKKSEPPPGSPPPPSGGPLQTIPEVDATNRMWLPQQFFMPDFGAAAVAAAFAPGNFLACEDAGFAGGCPEMDYPTTIPERQIVTHVDTTPSPALALAAALLGDPKLSFTGPSEMEVTVTDQGVTGEAVVVVANVGKGIAPFRIRSSLPWIVARHPSDGADRTLDGGVAIGSDIEVVTQAARPGRPRIAQNGYASTLLITVDTTAMPSGIHSGTVWIEPLFGGGGVFEMTVTAAKTGDPGSRPYRAIVPAVSSD